MFEFNPNYDASWPDDDDARQVLAVLLLQLSAAGGGAGLDSTVRTQRTARAPAAWRFFFDYRRSHDNAD